VVDAKLMSFQDPCGSELARDSGGSACLFSLEAINGIAALDYKVCADRKKSL
jgi:hypothetical protein